MLDVGDRAAPATVFTTPFERSTLTELASTGPILLLFYLFDWSATCTDEVSLLDARLAEFHAAGVHPYGISRDSPWTHIAWSQALDLDVPLLSDWNGEATQAFDVAHEYRGFADVSERCAFIVDETGVVRFARRYESGEVPDLDELLRAATGLAAGRA